MTAAPAPTPARSPRAHLVAALLAVGIFAAAAAGGCSWATAFERENFASFLPVLVEPKNHNEDDPESVNYLDHLKNQGVAVQQRAFERPDEFPLYGSSELLKRIPDKSSLFFRNWPTGFSVFPVGRPGCNSLLLLEKLAALGEVTRGKRIAISLSPSWILTQTPDERRYAGNFSRQQALGALLNGSLSFTFRRDLARRLLLHPETLQKDAVLRFVTARLAGGRRLDRLGWTAAWPLAQLQHGLYGAQDHFETALYMLRQPARHLTRIPRPEPVQLDWDRLLAEADAQSAPLPELVPYVAAGERVTLDEALFREVVERGQEWPDLKLLVRGLRELGMKPLILCMPVDGRSLVKTGVSRKELATFPARFRAVAGRWGAQVESFEDHEEDDRFLVDHADHLSAKGWMNYNRVLDEFYHTEQAPPSLHHRHHHTAANF
ncbi:MAG TPA: D-alanyl-lipoteichoic acid biosynthesis protein DltD [Chthoniobacteraceae bacterium]|jgi:D-alanine transfer protein|nr:D-alanyl-lipoteichoic acid biosynthesis protein DltD [Chthoniobacteraceae bacterium]